MAKNPDSKLASTFLLVTAISGFASAQTRYQVVRDHGVAWFQDAAGKRFTSAGVCVAETGTKFDDYDPSNPSYGAWRFYKSKADWAADTVRVLRSGGFNTIGAWSDYASLLAIPSNDLKMTPILHSGSSAGFPWTDMWDPALVKLSDDVAKGLIESLKRDKRIIGYFSDNELGWWRPALFEWVWKQKTHYTRHRVINLLRHRYLGSWQALTRDFDPGEVKNWVQLENRGKLCLKPGAAGQPAISEVQKMLADRYYFLSKNSVKRYDPGALYLGDRYISNYYPEVAEAAGKYCDVVSTNLNANWTDGGYVYYHLRGLARVTNKPLMITEYYMSSVENRSGNKNDRSGFPVVQTLTQRAVGFRNTTESLLKEPDVVGAHWFQYYDEPQNGRGDGENYNFGLVDVNNRPYQELLDTARQIDPALHTQAHITKPKGETLPKAPIDLSDMTRWNRNAALIPSDTEVPRGDLYASWLPDGIEMRLFWSEERFSEAYFRNGKIPTGDETKVIVDIPSSRTHWVRSLVPAQSSVGKDAWKSHGHVDSASWLTWKVPASSLSKKTLKSGDEVAMDVRLVSQTRSYQTVWHLRSRLGENP
jgi:hypothetical protein